MKELSLEEAKKLERKYWNINNQMPEREKVMTIVEWFYFKGYKMVKEESNE